MAEVVLYKPGFLGSTESHYSDVTSFSVENGVLHFRREYTPSDPRQSLSTDGVRYATNLPFLVSEVYGV